ncbi:gamma-aminobutyric acid receptor subunit alpha-6 [Ixodes scapularis]|nr:gamma-aminobutyric acid receptor subunit alpha-6 [Ixodes scapularis]
MRPRGVGYATSSWLGLFSGHCRRQRRGAASLVKAAFVGVLAATLLRPANGARPVAGIMANTSLLLDSLLSEKNYNRQFRPGFGGPPTEILTDVLIRSFGPVSENEMMFSMDCYFRQTWYDRRLRFDGDIKLLSVSWQFLEKVWTPDTYFFNGKSSYLHKVTVPNKFVRLRHDGRLKYSMRLTIKASCPMHLRKYPLDTQACPLEIGSFAYSSKEVVFKWKGPKPVDISSDVTLSQYEFLNITVANLTTYGPAGEVRSSLMARFILSRRRGYFILQIYAPCSLIVGASWVAFWINRSDAAGRVSVGATTVLTLVTMGFGGRASLPRVDYATALDWFVIMCFTFVFTALVEYACVNYLERFLMHRQRQRLEKLAKQEERQELAKEFNRESGTDTENAGSEDIRLRLERAEEIEEERRRTRLIGGCLEQLQFRWRRRKKRPIYQPCNTAPEERMTPSEVSAEVDAWARIIFPLTFTVLKVLYWTLFLYFVDDEIPEDPPSQN